MSTYTTIKNVFKIIYAPHKAFKEVIQDPKYIGPILIMILFVIANSGFYYVWFSKRYIDQTVPNYSEFDKWTENSAFWRSNAPTITNNTDDYVNGTYCGNKSIEFQANSTTQIWIQLNSTGSINCSGEQGYKNLTFSVKVIAEAETLPLNVTLYLFSTEPYDYFYYNLTDQLDTVNVWKNTTVTIGPENQEWKNNTANADWSNITSLMLDFTWQTESNITLLVDGLFFHGLYKPSIENSNWTLFPINSFMQFVIQWFILGCALYFVPKIFKLKTVWKLWLTVAGFTLIAVVIQQIAFTALRLSWPDFSISLKALGGVPGEPEEALMQSFTSFLTILWCIDRVVWVWIIALCAVAFKLAFGISWLKSFLTAVPSYLLYVLVLSIFQGTVIFLFEWELLAILFVIAVCIIFGFALSRKSVETTSN